MAGQLKKKYGNPPVCSNITKYQISDTNSRRTLSAGIAHINVGPQHTPFDVHLELLCECSPYFDAVCKDRFRSGVTEGPPIIFPAEDPDVFAEIVSWMYRGALAPDLESRCQVIFLFQLWVLAGKFQISALQNSAFAMCERKIDNNRKSVLSAATVSYVYARTDPGASPRQLVVDTWAKSATVLEYARQKDTFPRDFLEDLCGKLIANMELTREPTPVEGRPPVPLQSPQRKSIHKSKDSSPTSEGDQPWKSAETQQKAKEGAPTGEKSAKAEESQQQPKQGQLWPPRASSTQPIELSERVKQGPPRSASSGARRGLKIANLMSPEQMQERKYKDPNRVGASSSASAPGRYTQEGSGESKDSGAENSESS